MKTITVVTLEVCQYQMVLAFKRVPSWEEVLCVVGDLPTNDRTVAVWYGVTLAWLDSTTPPPRRSDICSAGGLKVDLQVIPYYKLEKSNG
jgi:hypothetical protein